MIVIYVIFAFILLNKISFVFSILSFVILTLRKFYKVEKKQLTIEDFIKRDSDITSAMESLHNANSYRTDINLNVFKSFNKFLNSYFEVLFNWDLNKYEEMILLETDILKQIQSLEHERDQIPYEEAFRLWEKVLFKYKNIIAEKYDFDIDAPKQTNEYGKINFLHNL
jgi:hypothetical protein